MDLEKEIAAARKEIVSSGYDMSVGEVINLYRDNELIINPAFQRLFRWDISQKTRFIESLLLGIPIPPIFVFQSQDGKWELVDGLQRLSTIFEFSGVLKDEKGKLRDAPELDGTNFLPSLAEKDWNSIGVIQQLQIKRARLRVEILQKESDPQAKYELFQRLNTGGSHLSEQEIRNCVAIMANPDFFEWLTGCANFPAFTKTTIQTDVALKKQSHLELALRFFAFRNVEYQKNLDVHEYLDKALVEMATNKNFPFNKEKKIFEATFNLLNSSLGENAFRKWDGKKFSGMFLQSVFEVISTGLSKKIDKVLKKKPADQKKFVLSNIHSLWKDPVFKKNSGMGVRGTTRLTNLLPLADTYFE